LTSQQALAAGFDPVHAIVAQSDRAHFYPSAKLMFIDLIADRRTRKILGIEAVGEQKDAIKARVDAVVPLIQAGMDVDDVCVLETAYAPPFASAMDIINNAGNALDNILEGLNNPMDAVDFIEEFKADRLCVLDVRDTKEVEPFVSKYKDRWLNISQSELRDRLDEVPRDKPLCLVCGTGTRSYECQVLLKQNGFTHIRNVQGGHAMLVAVDPEFI